MDLLTEQDAAAIAELQALVDRGAVQYLEERGKLAVAVHCHPSEPWAGWVTGYTVVLDPQHQVGMLTVR